MALADRTAQLAVTLIDVRGEQAGDLLLRLKRHCEEYGTTLRAAVSLAIWRHLDSPPPAPAPAPAPPQLPPCAEAARPPAKRGRKKKEEKG